MHILYQSDKLASSHHTIIKKIRVGAVYTRQLSALRVKHLL